MSDQPLHVAVDARCLNVEHLRGMGKMLHELVRRTAASGAVQWELFADRPDRPMMMPESERVSASVFETRGYRFAAWEQWSLPAAARRAGADLLHAPATTAPWWQPIPTVITVHDTIPWQQEDDAFPGGFYRDRLLPNAYHRAAAIITVSNNSRRDILARWPALKPRLHVIPNGVDERYLEAQPDSRPIEIDGRVLQEPYVVYVGGSDPRKRLTWALQTWWGSGSPGVTMVVCGVEAGSHDAVRRMVPRNLQDRLVLAPFISEDDMPRLYMRATAVLYPTLYEGFGLPVVEAHAVGTPVLFSDVGSLTELKGPASVVLPVDDLQAWVRALDLIVQSRSHRFGPDRIARAWAQQYSWDACVDRTLSVYHEVAHRHATSGTPAHHTREQEAS
jgi:glycosyltransferase involved in cell wall biosynthesis